MDIMSDSIKEAEPSVELKQLDEKAEKLYDSGQTPEDVSAQFFFLYHPKFSARLNKLSSRQLRRIINALVKFPLEKDDYDPKNEDEREAFMLGDRLLTSKYVMQIYVISQAMQQQQAVGQQMREQTQTSTVSPVEQTLPPLEVTMEDVSLIEKEKSNG